MWKLLFQSVRGTSHERSGQACQDCCLARLKATRLGPVLVLACADGAGSVLHAELGAREACQGITRLVLDDLAQGLPLAEVERDTVLSWHIRLRLQLQEQADRHQTGLDQLACTLLLAVVGESTAVFSQIGDGAIVLLRDESYHTVFWPQSGEYANTTNFVTDPEFADHLEVHLERERVEELALLSDGLQMLALTFAGRQVHQPFFQPLFQRLRSAKAGEKLAHGLRQFLTSPAVNARSDDDKTLVLATRVPSRATAPQLA
jgi:hypothetical protein